MQPPKTRYARAGDVHIAYQVIGDGPIDIVIVPNWITHIEAMWEIPSIGRALERLAKFSRTIVYDQRGTGLSDPVPLDSMPTLEQRMADIPAVMDAAAVQRAAIVGFQSAGPLSILFAATYPQRTTGLVLANSYARMAASEDYEIGISAERVTALIEAIAGTWGTTTAVPGWSHSDAPRTLEMWARYQRQAASPGTAAAMLRSMLENDVRRVLPDLRVPTLVLAYEHHDPTGRPTIAHSRYLAERIPSAQFVAVGGEGPADLNGFIDEIEEFLTGERGAVETERALTTVLVTDIVGSTELAASLGDGAWRELLDRHDGMVRRQLDRFRGREIKTLGDGFLATFDGPGRAIRCAEAIRDAAPRLNLQVRIGLHTGEVELRGEDVAGIAVHIASRVAGQAEPSEVLVSRTVTDLVAGSGISFSERGDHELKGVPGIWQLFAVADPNPRQG